MCILFDLLCFTQYSFYRHIMFKCRTSVAEEVRHGGSLILHPLRDSGYKSCIALDEGE